jgi:hypothetical protein
MMTALFNDFLERAGSVQNVDLTYAYHSRTLEPCAAPSIDNEAYPQPPLPSKHLHHAAQTALPIFALLRQCQGLGTHPAMCQRTDKTRKI